MTEYSIQMRLANANGGKWRDHTIATSSPDTIGQLLTDIFRGVINHSFFGQLSMIQDLQFRAVESTTSKQVAIIGFDHDCSHIRVANKRNEVTCIDTI